MWRLCLAMLRRAQRHAIRLRAAQLSVVLLCCTSAWATASGVRDRPPPSSGPKPSRKVLRDWMDIRRGGPASVIADARKSSAAEVWTATWSLQVASDAAAQRPSRERLAIQVTRAPPARPDSRGRLLVQVLQPPALRGVGLLVDENGVWVRRTAKGGAEPATDSNLSAPIDGWGLPLAVFAAGEWHGEHATRTSYDTVLEGEFGDTAVLRFKPQYEAGPQTPILKAGVSKRFGTWTLGEIDDRNGQPLAKVEWLEPQARDSVAIAEMVRLWASSGQAATLERISHQVGGTLRWQGGPKALAKLR